MDVSDARRLKSLEDENRRLKSLLADTPTIVPDTSIGGERLARELDKLIDYRGKPTTIVSDNGTEMTSNAILKWQQETNINWHYIAPGK